MSEQFDQLSDLLTHELQDLYDAEHRLLDALREMAEAASDSERPRGLRAVGLIGSC